MPHCLLQFRTPRFFWVRPLQSFKMSKNKERASGQFGGRALLPVWFWLTIEDKTAKSGHPPQVLRHSCPSGFGFDARNDFKKQKI